MVAGAFSRESLPAASDNIASLLDELNFRLMHISDRLDKLEGLRGDAENLGDQEIDGNLSVGGALSVTGAAAVTGTLRALTSLIVSGSASLASLSTNEIDLSGGLVVDSLVALPAVRLLDDLMQIQAHQQLTGSFSAPSIETIEAFISDAWVNRLQASDAETGGLVVASLTTFPGTQALDETLMFQSGLMLTGSLSASYLEVAEDVVVGGTLAVGAMDEIRVYDDTETLVHGMTG